MAEHSTSMITFHIDDDIINGNDTQTQETTSTTSITNDTNTNTTVTSPVVSPTPITTNGNSLKPVTIHTGASPLTPSSTTDKTVLVSDDVLPSSNPSSPPAAVKAAPIAVVEEQKQPSRIHEIIPANTRITIRTSDRVNYVETTWRDSLKTLGRSMAYLVFIFYPILIGIMWGAFEIYRKHGQVFIDAMSIIWIVFAVGMVAAFAYGGHIRRKAEAQALRDEEQKHAQLQQLLAKH